jgi:hypothetical protein
VLAAMGALRAFRKPEISVLNTAVSDKASVSKIVVHHSDEREPLPLALHHTPLSITLGVLKQKPIPSDLNDDGSSTQKVSALLTEYLFLVDPSSQEAFALDGDISFSLNAHRELCAVSKPGGVSLPVSALMEAANLALRKVQYLHLRLNEALAELESKIVIEREERQVVLREYNARVVAEKHNRKTLLHSTGIDGVDEMEIDDMEDDSAEFTVGGIDRNDPILQWTNLHKPVLSKSATAVDQGQTGKKSFSK